MRAPIKQVLSKTSLLIAKFSKRYLKTPSWNFVLKNKLQKALYLFFFFKLGFPPCKSEQPLRGMELEEKEAQKDYRIQEICLERTYS